MPSSLPIAPARPGTDQRSLNHLDNKSWASSAGAKPEATKSRLIVACSGEREDGAEGLAFPHPLDDILIDALVGRVLRFGQGRTIHFGLGRDGLGRGVRRLLRDVIAFFGHEADIP